MTRCNSKCYQLLPVVASCNNAKCYLPGATLLEAGARLGFSFRTCAPGELLKQTGDSFDQLEVRLLGDPGRVHVRVHAGDRHLDVVSDANR